LLFFFGGHVSRREKRLEETLCRRNGGVVCGVRGWIALYTADLWCLAATAPQHKPPLLSFFLKKREEVTRKVIVEKAVYLDHAMFVVVEGANVQQLLEPCKRKAQLCALVPARDANYAMRKVYVGYRRVKRIDLALDRSNVLRDVGVDVGTARDTHFLVPAPVGVLMGARTVTHF
jgi:hypothetical protein